MLSVMEVKSTRILPCAMSNAACAAMRMTPEDANCFTSCCFRWDSSSWDFLLRQKLTMGFSMILVMTLKLTRKSHLQDRSDLRMISDDNDWLPFDPFVLFFLCAMPWLWRPHQSMPWFSEPTPSKLLLLHNMLQVCHAVLFQALSLSCKVAMTTSHPIFLFNPAIQKYLQRRFSMRWSPLRMFNPAACSQYFGSMLSGESLSNMKLVMRHTQY